MPYAIYGRILSNPFPPHEMNRIPNPISSQLDEKKSKENKIKRLINFYFTKIVISSPPTPCPRRPNRTCGAAAFPSRRRPTSWPPASSTSGRWPSTTCSVTGRSRRLGTDCITVPVHDLAWNCVACMEAQQSRQSIRAASYDAGWGTEFLRTDEKKKNITVDTSRAVRESPFSFPLLLEF